jgi:hypothetical protein
MVPGDDETGSTYSSATADAWLLIDYRLMCECVGPLSLADFLAGYRSIDEWFAHHPVPLPEMQLAS